MIISFFGHGKQHYDNSVDDKLFDCLKNIINDDYIEFYLGGYGNFDKIVNTVCSKFRNYANSSIKKTMSHHI